MNETEYEANEYLDTFVALGGSHDKEGTIQKETLINIIKVEFELIGFENKGFGIVIRAAEGHLLRVFGYENASIDYHVDQNYDCRFVPV